MVKKKKTNKPRSVSEDGEVLRVRLPEEGEVLGQVVQILGGGILLVRCLDNNTRKVRIPGKFRKRMWTRVGDIVAVMPEYGMREDEWGTLTYRYRNNEAIWLEKNGYIPSEFLL